MGCDCINSWSLPFYLLSIKNAGGVRFHVLCTLSDGMVLYIVTKFRENVERTRFLH